MKIFVSVAITSILAWGCSHRGHTPSNVREHTLPVRAFSVKPDATAAALFRKRELEHQRSERLDLYYEQAGFGALAEIFRPIDKADAITQAEHGFQTVRWSCIEDYGADVSGIAKKIRNLREDANYEMAAKEAEDGLQVFPASCQIQMEWASSTFWMSAMNPRGVDPVKQERAIRILITGAAEIGMGTAGIDAAQVLRDVARYFRHVGDFVVERNTLLLARRQTVMDLQRSRSVVETSGARDLQQEIDRELERNAADRRQSRSDSQ